MSKKIVVVKKSSKAQFPLRVPVNVKVAGERTMRKNVTLLPASGGAFKVLTGRRGRPAVLTADQIEKVRAL